MKNKKVLVSILAILATLSVSAAVFIGCNPTSDADNDNQVSVEQPDNGNEDDNQVEEQQPETGNEGDDQVEEQQPETGNEDDNQVEEQQPETGNEDDNQVEEQQPETGNEGDNQVEEQQPETGNEGDNQLEEQQPETGSEGDSQVEEQQPETDSSTEIEFGTDVLYVQMAAGSSVSSLSSAKEQTVSTVSKAVKSETSTETAYSQYRGESFYIDVQFTNPKKYKVVGFTISFAGKKVQYSNSKFESGSTASDIYVKATATYNNAAYTEYTISNITYIDGNTIKKVAITDNDSVLVGIKDVRSDTSDKVFIGNCSNGWYNSYYDAYVTINSETGELEFLENPVIDSYTMVTISSEYIKDGVLTIPSEYNGKPVTMIDSYAFAYSDIKEVIIPDSITQVGYGAFYDCESLKKVTIGANVTFINSMAFYNCKNLSYVNYNGTLVGWMKIGFGKTASEQQSDIYDYNDYTDNSYRNKYMRMANPTFYAHDLYIQGKLVEGELVIPDEIEAVLQCTFARCQSITSVKLHDGVKSIGYYAFTTCSGINNIDLASVQIIDTNAFNGCYGLTSITIPQTVTSIRGTGDSAAFYVTQKLVEVYNLSKLDIVAGSSDNGRVALFADNVYSNTQTINITEDKENGFLWYTKQGDEKIYLIGYNGSEEEITVPYTYNGKQVELMRCVFAGNTIVKKVTFAEGFTKLPDRAFAYCDSIEEVILPSTMTTIGDHAFWDSSIKRLVLPEACKEVEGTAFCDLTDFTLTIMAKDIQFAYHAFSTCTNLTVYYAGTLDQWLEIIEDDFTGNSSYKGIMYWSTNYTIICSDSDYSE